MCSCRPCCQDIGYGIFAGIHFEGASIWSASFAVPAWSLCSIPRWADHSIPYFFHGWSWNFTFRIWAFVVSFVVSARCILRCQCCTQFFQRFGVGGPKLGDTFFGCYQIYGSWWALIKSRNPGQSRVFEDLYLYAYAETFLQIQQALVHLILPDGTSCDKSVAADIQNLFQILSIKPNG